MYPKLCDASLECYAPGNVGGLSRGEGVEIQAPRAQGAVSCPECGAVLHWVTQRRSGAWSAIRQAVQEHYRAHHFSLGVRGRSLGADEAARRVLAHA